MRNYYLAGPMTGKPYHNVHMFERVALRLRNWGLNVTVPIELDGEEWREQALSDPEGTCHFGDRTWGDFLSRDVKEVADNHDAIILLPDWYNSKGARLEAFVALQAGHALFEWAPGYKCGGYQDLVICSPKYVMKMIQRHTMEDLE